MQGRKRRLVGTRRGARRALLAAASLAALCATLGGAAPAQAGIRQELAAFYDCPLSNPTVTACLVSKTTSGEFVLGSKTAPITKTITLQGGVAGGVNEEGSALVPAADGNTLSRTPLTVNGGLVGIELLGITEVTATAELAGPVILNLGNLGSNNQALALPLKVKLDNPLLIGGTCFVGSDTDPVTLRLITGTTNPPPPNSPITGNKGTVHVYDHNKIIEVAGSSLVDNSFAAPGANGCVRPLDIAVDLVVDLDAGLPAASGHNTAILNSSFVTTTPRVIQSEAVLPQIGRCKKVAPVKEGGKRVWHGRYETSNCVLENPFALGSTVGKFEWSPGPGPNNKFTGSSGKVTLETVGHQAITCLASTNAGEYTGEKTATATLTLTGCKRVATGEACQSSGAAAGEIVTSALSGELGFIKDFYEGEETLKVSVGLDLKHSPTLATAQCGAAVVEVSGSVIVPLSKVDKMATSFTAKFAAPGGKQVPEAFEEGPTDVLTSNLAGTNEQTGLTASAKFVNQEPIEIKAATE